MFSKIKNLSTDDIVAMSLVAFLLLVVSSLFYLGYKEHQANVAVCAQLYPQLDKYDCAWSSKTKMVNSR